LAENENDESAEEADDSPVSNRLFWLLTAGFVLVFVGMLVVVAAVVLSAGSSASAGVVIFIGPFPIVFGAGPDAALLIVIGVILAALSVVFFVLMRRKKG
jgi:uncharacterized membrane protein